MNTYLVLALLIASVASSGLTVAPSSSTNSVAPITTTYPAVDLQGLYLKSITGSNTMENIQNAISNAKKTNIIADQNIDALFVTLPSTAEIDQIIESADSLALLKVIQTLATSTTLPCDKIVAYLLELLGRIRSAIQKKQFSADQLTVIIDGANAEIARLQNLINQANTARANLNLDQLKASLQDFVNKLTPLYAQLNDIGSQIPPNEARITGLNN